MADKPAIKIMEWSEKFIVDNGLIDNDHKFLIELINEFNENVPNFSKPEDMKPYLLSLKKYTQTHFAREERLQEAAQYNLRKEHRVEHRDMIAQLLAYAGAASQLLEAAQLGFVVHLNECWVAAQ